jgi:hypothetical protein
MIKMPRKRFDPKHRTRKRFLYMKNIKSILRKKSSMHSEKGGGCKSCELKQTNGKNDVYK